MKYICIIKLLDGSRFEFETDKNNVDFNFNNHYIIVPDKEKEIYLNADNVVFIVFKKGE